MAAIVVTKLIHETHPLNFKDNDGRSIGQLIDATIIDALEMGHEMHSISLEIAPEEWRMMREAHLGPEVEQEPRHPHHGGMGKSGKLHKGPKRAI